MKKALSVIVVLTLFLSMSACSQDVETQGGQKDSAADKESGQTENIEVTEGTPSYEDDKQLELFAYCGPRRGGYRWEVNGEHHPDDPQGGWNSFITEKDFQDYVDCGFTFLFAEGDAPYDYNCEKGVTVSNFADSSLYEYMELAERMNIPVVVQANQLVQMASSEDYRLTEDQKAFLAEMVGDLSTYNCFKGVTLRDEPTPKLLKTFEAIEDYLISLKSDIDILTCMLPVYGAPHLGVDTGSLEAYQNYIDDFAAVNGSFVYDYYPLMTDPQHGNYLMDTWFQNLEMVAKSAKENQFTGGVVVQSSAFGPLGGEGVSTQRRAITTKADVGYQVYTALAYGMKEIGYFTYWQHWNTKHPEVTGEDYYSAMVMYPEENGQESVKTDAYYAVQDINMEVKKFDHVLMNFEWQGTMAVQKSDPYGTLKYISDYTAPRIESVDATEDTIIGHLKDGDGYDGFMIVNVTEPSQGLSTNVTVKFKEASSALAYIEGEETAIELQDGSYTFELAPGAGVFVIPIK